MAFIGDTALLATDLPGDITMKETDGIPYTLPRVSPSEARETLGVFLAVDDDFLHQTDSLRDKTTSFALCLQQGNLSPTEAWTAIRTTLWKCIEYPMEAVTLTAAQWASVLRPITRPLLHSCSFARSFKHDVLFGPSQGLGLNLKHPLPINLSANSRSLWTAPTTLL